MTIRALSLLVLVAALAGAGGYHAARTGRAHPAAPDSPSSAVRKIRFYQSPMHPWIKSDKPGKCTICGMALVPVYEGEDGVALRPGLIVLSPGAVTAAGVQTSAVARGPLVRTLRVTGVIEDDETRRRVLAARVPGRVEKLHVNQVGAEVAAGEPLVTLYSPEVLNASRLYIERLKAGPDAFTVSEVAEAREKLLMLGLTGADITRLEKTRVPESTLVVRSPLSGTIVARSVYEGQYVQPETVLFEIADLSRLWFIFDAYEDDFPALKSAVRVEVSVPSLPGEVFSAPIDFIDPSLDPATRTARVRVVLDNPARRLLRNQTASARVVSRSPEVLLVPRDAVLFTRSRPVVYLDEGGHAYEARAVRLGRAGDDAYEVLGGLEPGDRVVTEGALLIDGQAEIDAVAADAPRTDAP